MEKLNVAARCRSAVSQYLLLMSCTKVIDEASVCLETIERCLEVIER